MSKFNKSFGLIITIFILLAQIIAVKAQTDSKSEKSKGEKSAGKLVLWKPVNISEQNLLLGPGGKEMSPNLDKITFIEEVKGGYSEKYRIKDGSGVEWVAKVSDEAQSETAAVRLIWALGYPSEINYLVPELTIPGKGTFKNVRLEARPANLDRKENWSWNNNPFMQTYEFQGLKIMMAFLNNWDLKTSNNVIIHNNETNENYYIISDLGVSFGKLGSNGLPIFWRIGRSRNDPVDYSQSKFVKGVKNDKVELFYNGKSPGVFNDITVAQARWLADLLLQLSDEQISDAFRAANYTPEEVKLLTQEVKERISELDKATKQTEAENKSK